MRLDVYTSEEYGAVDSSLFGAAGYYDVDTLNGRTLLSSDFVSMEAWDLPLPVQTGSCPDRGWRYFPMSLLLPNRKSQRYQGRAELIVVGGAVNQQWTPYIQDEVRVTMSAEVNLRKVSG